jgi:hypothetical protein
VVFKSLLSGQALPVSQFDNTDLELEFRGLDLGSLESTTITEPADTPPRPHKRRKVISETTSNNEVSLLEEVVTEVTGLLGLEKTPQLEGLSKVAL